MMARRFASQLLSGPRARDPVAVVERLLAVQAQDPRGARLAIRARTKGVTAADVDRALTVDRSLVVTWVNRGTLHLVRSEDYFWLHALTTPQLVTANARRLSQEGVSPRQADRGVELVVRALDAGPLTRSDLRARLAAKNVPVGGQALVHILMLATIRGHVVRGPMAGREHAYVLVRDWLGRPPAIDRDAAMRELARRYVAGHAPAGDRDLARWAGVPLRDARAGLSAIGPEIVERADGLAELRGRRARAAIPSPRLLGPFEPVLLGWSSRAEIVGPRARILGANGIFHPFALVDGRVVARWSMAGGSLAVEPFRRLSRDEVARLETDARDVARFFGDASA